MIRLDLITQAGDLITQTKAGVTSAQACTPGHLPACVRVCVLSETPACNQAFFTITPVGNQPQRASHTSSKRAFKLAATPVFMLRMSAIRLRFRVLTLNPTTVTLVAPVSSRAEPSLEHPHSCDANQPRRAAPRHRLAASGKHNHAPALQPIPPFPPCSLFPFMSPQVPSGQNTPTHKGFPFAPSRMHSNLSNGCGFAPHPTSPTGRSGEARVPRRRPTCAAN